MEYSYWHAWTWIALILHAGRHAQPMKRACFLTSKLTNNACILIVYATICINAHVWPWHQVIASWNSSYASCTASMCPHVIYHALIHACMHGTDGSARLTTPAFSGGRRERVWSTRKTCCLSKDYLFCGSPWLHCLNVGGVSALKSCSPAHPLRPTWAAGFAW